MSAIKDWLKVFIFLLDEIVIAGVLVFVLWLIGVRFSPVTIVIIAMVTIGAGVIMHKAIIPTFHKKQITGAEGLIGMEGEVVESLSPKGTVRIECELWKAQSIEGEIPAGGEVEVIEVNGLKLKVRARKPPKEKT